MDLSNGVIIDDEIIHTSVVVLGVLRRRKGMDEPTKFKSIHLGNISKGRNWEMKKHLVIS